MRPFYELMTVWFFFMCLFSCSPFLNAQKHFHVKVVSTKTLKSATFLAYVLFLHLIYVDYHPPPQINMFF